MPQKDFTVVRYGLDSSGRPIYMTRWMVLVWEAMLADPRLASIKDKVVIVQGAFMERNGGGASASAGYHDKAGPLDTRTWNLTTAELDLFISVTDDYGFPFWRRDQSAAHGGMDPHAHGLLLSDQPMASGAATQRSQYMRGESGLASGGPDYEKRNKPLVLEPPTSLLEGDDMADPQVKKQLDAIESNGKKTLEALQSFRTNEVARDQRAAKKAKEVARRQIALLGGLADTLGTLATEKDIEVLKRRVAETQKKILTALADDPDVDGPDNPAQGA